MLVCADCDRWHPTSATTCATCGGALRAAPPPTLRRRPPSAEDALPAYDEELHAATIAAWWDKRGRQSGPGAGAVAAEVAARIRRGHPGNEQLWRCWGHHDAWWPDWEAEEALNELLVADADPDLVIAEAVRWAELLSVHDSGDQVARWLKVVARQHEQEARRAAGARALLDRAALLRSAARAAREPRHEASCRRLHAARRRPGGSFTNGPDLREIADHAEMSGPDELLDRLVATAEATPTRPEDPPGIIGGCLLAAAFILVPIVNAIDEALRWLVARLRGRRP
jgi:hypothetical protein